MVQKPPIDEEATPPEVAPAETAPAKAKKSPKKRTKKKKAAKEGPSIAVSVRALVEFVSLSGDLVRGTGFVGSSGMEAAHEGTRGHQEIQASRPENYDPEVYLTELVESGGFTLKVRGRVDGVWHQPNGDFLIEEIKTISGRREVVAHPNHWGQGKVYAHMYLEKRRREEPEKPLPTEVVVQLTYLNRRSGAIQQFSESCTREALAAHFATLVDDYCSWVGWHMRWMVTRNASIDALEFPYPDYRPGQRNLAVAAYRTIANKGALFAEAPTGIGKTVATIFPAVKAIAQGEIDKIFYLTARTTGRAVAQKAFKDLQKGGLRCRTVTFTARDKICFSEGDPPCDTSTCPFAIGYYDRIKDAMRDAVEYDMLDRPTLEEIARKHTVCPFELSLDVSSWCDAIICDLNYAFDPVVYLRRYFNEEEGAYTFLVDEAHNLVDRARKMFSASLDKRSILDVRKAIRSHSKECGRLLHAMNRSFVRWQKLLTEGPEPTLFAEETAPSATVRRSAGEQALEIEALPTDFVELVQDFIEEAEICIPQLDDTPDRAAILEFYFQCRGFARTAELYDERYVTLFTKGRQSERLQLYCIDPSTLLLAARERADSTLFFSATLQPLDYFRTLLGESEDDTILQLPSPFPEENLRLHVEDRIATTYRERSRTYEDVALAIVSLLLAQPGNTLVFFPSYAYMREVLVHFHAHLPALSAHIPEGQVLVQTPRMSEEDRAEYLAAFETPGEGSLVGFAVMGGIFGEGIDLVGDRLSGVVIVGVALPQVCVERDIIRDYFNTRTNEGFAYAYIYPGMNKVLQAVGRLIRTEVDTGAALLIDQRFGQGRYRRLFPGWWHPQRAARSLPRPTLPMPTESTEPS